jgi:hypothetical protein
MNTNTLKRVRQMFNNPLVPAHHNRSYQRQWVRQVRMLGDRWLLAKHMDRASCQ